MHHSRLRSIGTCVGGGHIRHVSAPSSVDLMAELSYAHQSYSVGASVAVGRDVGKGLGAGVWRYVGRGVGDIVGVGVGLGVGEWVDTETESTDASDMLKARPSRPANHANNLDPLFCATFGLSRRPQPELAALLISEVSVPSVTAACSKLMAYEKSVMPSSASERKALRAITTSKSTVTLSSSASVHTALSTVESVITSSMAATKMHSTKSEQLIPLIPMLTWTRGSRVGAGVGTEEGLEVSVGAHVAVVGTGTGIGHSS